MKKIIFFLILIYSSVSFCQVSGKTQTGSLFFKKPAPKNDTAKISVPKISLLEPILNSNNEFKTNSNSVEIRGIVKSDMDLNSLKINDAEIQLQSDNYFVAKIKLNDGVNPVIIKAINSKYKEGKLLFNVIVSGDNQGPIVKIIEPVVSRGIKIVKKSDVMTVKGLAYDPSGVKEVYVNDQKSILQNDGNFSVDLYLQVGDNPIIVKAFDNKFNVSLDTFIVTRKIEEIISGGRYIALVIGINSYSGYWPSLKNAVNDAEGVAKVLKKDYTFDTVYTLLDKDATRRNIIQKFEWLTRNITKDDNVLIFYAGHGQFNKALNKGYWVPVDAKSNSVADYISNSDVKTFMGGIPSKHTLLITDACFAGDIFRGPPTQSIEFDPNNMTKYFREVYRKQSRLALTSGGVEEVSDAGKDHHSIFTYYLIKSLRENNRKYIDVTQLYNDFRVAVVNNSEQTPELQVIRDTDDEGGQFIFIRKNK